MLKNPGLGPALSDVRNGYNAEYFKVCKLIERNALGENQALWNLMVQGEVNRLDTKERLDSLVELQKELLATQREILAELKKR
jgi:predicted NAD-dependent protein-ADP-ribosyltransferase YbiA (DUF1768 family)